MSNTGYFVMRNAKVLVVGAGAIGGLVGGRLAAAGCEVTLLGRKSLVHAVVTTGLHLQWPDGTQRTVHPQAIENLTELDQLADFALVLITVKSFATASSVQGLVGKLSPTAPILSLQNGVGNEETLTSLLPGQPIIAGSITLPVRVPQVGTIVVSKEKGGIGLAPTTTGANVDDLARLLQRAGFEVITCADYHSLKWSKLMMNIIGNASSAILDMPPGASLVHREIFDLEIAALRETLAVMQARNIKVIPLPGYPLPWLAVALRWLPNPMLRQILKSAITGGRGDKLPSLQLDLRQGRNQSEVTVLNRVVATEGEQTNIPVPVNKGLSNILEGIVKGEVYWEDYKEKPELLWAQLRAK